ncbi:hypothetical protein E2L07_17545 [Halalkalibacterium halodurans]|uniref:hypothetical protein n=1 Tax=Halalkalibacterium halodurans TaxID=86665 RepID=UPI0010682EF1|nr:hypothetical protein [Halalkalibacterium halodurans]TES48994.1 hypothetical protein E2L07_17545 [Halalkalibacterium halodurans]
MLHKEELQHMVKEALESAGGSANIVTISKYVWSHYETELKESGDLFYTWQYDIRWAANELRRKGIMKDAEKSPRGIWELV